MIDGGEFDEVEQLQDKLFHEHVGRGGDPTVAGAAMLLAGLQILADPFRLSVSRAERDLILTHYPDATDETIAAHRLDRKGLMFVLEFVVTAGRKYLDHQPETSNVLVATQSRDNLDRLVPTIARGVSNSFASAAPLDASAYDIAAAIITNTVARAMTEHVAPEQLMTILLENVQRVIAEAPDDHA